MCVDEITRSSCATDVRTSNCFRLRADSKYLRYYTKVLYLHPSRKSTIYCNVFQAIVFGERSLRKMLINVFPPSEPHLEHIERLFFLRRLERTYSPAATS